MTRRFAFPLALLFSVFSLSLVSSHSTAQAQQPQRLMADVGVVTLGPNQVLRVTAYGGGDTGTHEVGIRFRKTTYAPAGCSGDGVCRLAVTSQAVTALQWTAGPVEIQITDGTSVRVVVESNVEVRVSAAIIDGTTGATITQISAPNQSSKLD